MSTGTPAPSPEPPLCVDLDGTLLRTDALLESALVLLKANPFLVLLLPLWLGRGKAALKREIASRVTLDSATLPYHAELLAHLRKERTNGRRLVLTSASDEKIARAIAEHLQIFDDVIASDGTRNLKGEVKRAVLTERYGRTGYDYAGNHAADLEVWRDARDAILVSSDQTLVRRAGSRVRHVFSAPRGGLTTVLRVLRIQQWVKNLLVFVPLLMSPEAVEPSRFVAAFLAFTAFSLCASSVYVTNDLLDLEADRRHGTKRRRPFAAGDLPLSFGFVLAPACLLAGLAIAWLLPPRFPTVLFLYMVASTLYSFWFKHAPIVDVIVLAILYTGRVIAGAAATYVEPSPWILGFSLFFFLSLAFVKRYAELYGLRQDHSSLKVRGYYPADLEMITISGVVSGYIAVLVAALYINGDRVAAIYRYPMVLWLICPLLLYWISRIWMLAHRGELHDDPLVFAIKDATSYAVGALIGLVLLLARL